jgi:DNA-binding TFAR19-related protein (PDSD5 family)
LTLLCAITGETGRKSNLPWNADFGDIHRARTNQKSNKQKHKTKTKTPKQPSQQKNNQHPEQQTTNQNLMQEPMAKGRFRIIVVVAPLMAQVGWLAKLAKPQRGQ